MGNDQQRRDPWVTDSRLWMFHDPRGVLGEAARKGATIQELLSMEPTYYRGAKVVKGNQGLDAGIIHLIDLVTGLDPTAVKLDSTHAKIGVGNSNGAAQASQTQLEAERLGMSATWVGMDAGFPRREGTTMIFRSSFLSGVAVWDWLEWSVAFEISPGVRRLLNRKVENVGTKPLFDLWIFETGLQWG